ncbi:hypothetical protein X733_33500 [Mesorhizobium sp. L2C067A000]|nr:hypothetical protein X733_33500 [Mesorhizobium sp. L2C067A000]
MNVALSIFLGLYLGWGVAGVAWATVYSQDVAMIAGATILFGRFRALPKVPRQHTFNKLAIRRIFSSAVTS